MKIKNIPEAQFLLSTPNIGLAPKRPLPEIAFAGRSNVGKSSLINSLLNRKQLALSSKTPGKTRLLNYFLIGGNLCYFVDLPGYGYARVGREIQEEWSVTLEGYMRDSHRLALTILILDIRQGLTELDEQMVEAFHIYNRRWIAVLSKADKLNISERSKAHQDLRGLLVSQGARDVLLYSALSNEGRDELWEQLFAVIKEKK